MSPPNVLFILTDQQRLSAVGCYGNTPCRTPHIDRLAREGVRFETAYTSCPVCTPARASLMTGLYPHAHGMRTNINDPDCLITELPDSPRLLSRRLGRAGYRCGFTGKWHMGDWYPGWNLAADHRAQFNIPPLDRSLPETRGFEGHGGSRHQCTWLSDDRVEYPSYLEYLAQNKFEHRFQRLKSGAGQGFLHDNPIEATVAHYLAQNTIGLIDTFADAGEPFLLWHNEWGPHGPHYSTRELLESYRDVDIPPWGNFGHTPGLDALPATMQLHPRHGSLSWEDWAESIRHYYAYTTLIDMQIGRILDHLERRGLADNTWVIFASDHGEMIGSHGGLTNKGWNHYEEDHRIPLIIRPPGRSGIQGGRVMREFASLLDLHPTILQIAGADFSDEQMHGSNLLPLLEGRAAPWRDAIFSEFFGHAGSSTTMITCRHGQFKYGYNCAGRDELYDLDADPHEVVNLVDSPAHVSILREMRRRTFTWIIDTAHPADHLFLFSRLHGDPGQPRVNHWRDFIVPDMRWR